jgi:hypothetical protein
LPVKAGNDTHDGTLLEKVLNAMVVGHVRANAA